MKMNRWTLVLKNCLRTFREEVKTKSIEWSLPDRTAM
jgi:hypothetical protein